MTNEMGIQEPHKLVHELELPDKRRYRVLDTCQPYKKGYPDDNEAEFLTAVSGFMIQTFLEKSFPDSPWMYIATAETIEAALLTIGMYARTRDMDKIKAMIVSPDKQKSLPPQETEHQVNLGMQMLLNDPVSTYVIYENTIHPDVKIDSNDHVTEESPVSWSLKLQMAKLQTIEELRKKYPNLIFIEKEDRTFEEFIFKGQPAKRLSAVTMTVSIKRKPSLDIIKDRIITDPASNEFYRDVTSYLLEYINDPELTNLVESLAPDL